MEPEEAPAAAAELSDDDEAPVGTLDDVGQVLIALSPAAPAPPLPLLPNPAIGAKGMNCVSLSLGSKRGERR